MPYRICKTLEIENGHMLAKHPDKCRFPHGHSRRVEFVLESEELDGREMVCDFKIIKSVMKDFLDTYDHAMCMNTEDPMFGVMREAYGGRVIGFAGEDPTTEVLAREIYRHCHEGLGRYLERDQSGERYPLRRSVRLVKVRVWETSSSWAEYEP